MNCEIEFMPVGDASRAGDAIVVRYGEINAYELMIVDGGTTETGQNVVAHVRENFGAHAVIQHVVLTHADGDHASGLREVLRELPVRNLWLFVPWFHAEEALPLFSGNWTADGLRTAIKKEYDIINELVELAAASGCVVQCPEAGLNIGPFRVLSPARVVYVHLLPQFEKTPEANQQALEHAGMWIGKSSFLAKLIDKMQAKAEKWIEESWYGERLKDGGKTSASNESSLILYGNFYSHRILLTGDAGVEALNWAANHATNNGFPLQGFTFVQIPHHGSRRNVGPTILNRILGPILPEGTEKSVAFVSVPKDDENHPRKIVLNAFIRRGHRVIATRGSKKIHWGGFPMRPGYSAAESIPFSTSVEEYD